MGNDKMKQFIRGAFILTIAGFISKILSAFYRIPIQNLTGDYGFYIYQQIYPFIATVTILSLYSFPAAISKLGAELGKKKVSFKHFLLPIFLILLCINGLLFLIIYVLSPVIAMTSGNISLKIAYQTIAFAFLVVPFLAVSRGFYQAKGKMEQTAFSQLIEQIIRVGIIIYICYLIFIGQLDIYKIGDIGALATIIGMVAAILFLFFTFFNEKKDVQIQPYKIPWLYYLRTLLFFGVVTSLNHMVFIIIQFGDVFTLIPNLLTYGFSAEEAMVWKGVFDRGVPLIQLGIVIGSSFAVALIPVISANKSLDHVSTTIQHALALCLYIAGGATVGVIVLFPEINLLLFNDMKGTTSLRIFALAILFISMIVTINAILQSLGYMFRTVFYILIIFLLKIGLNKLLIPHFGLVGASYATVISLSLLAIITIYQLKKVVPSYSLFSGIKGTSFMIANGGMAIYLLICKYILPFNYFSRITLLVYVMFLVASGAIIYFIILLRYKAFNEEQINIFPFSAYIQKLSLFLSR